MRKTGQLNNFQQGLTLQQSVFQKAHLAKPKILIKAKLLVITAITTTKEAYPERTKDNTDHDPNTPTQLLRNRN